MFLLDQGNFSIGIARFEAISFKALTYHSLNLIEYFYRLPQGWPYTNPADCPLLRQVIHQCFQGGHKITPGNHAIAKRGIARSTGYCYSPTYLLY